MRGNWKLLSAASFFLGGGVVVASVGLVVFGLIVVGLIVVGSVVVGLIVVAHARFFQRFYSCLNVDEATHTGLLIGTSFASLTRNKITTSLICIHL